jgi:hypothetical protein
MFNTLEMTAITHNGFGQHNPLADRYEASAAFERALRRGKGRALRQKLLGRERGLRRLPKGGATTARRPAQQSAMSSASPCHRSSAARGAWATSTATSTR